MDPIILTRQVEVEKYEVLMEIGRQQQREELVAVLMLAEQRGGRVTAADICSELLLNRPESFGKAVIDRCQYLDLLDQYGRLTDLGNEVLQTRKVFVPERGRYILWYTEDSLIPQKLLHLQAVRESSAVDEVEMARNGYPSEESREETVEELPKKLLSLKDKEFDLMGKAGGPAVIRKIENNGLARELDQQDKLSVTLRIARSGRSQLSLDGKFNRLLKPPEITFQEAWHDVLGNLARYWEESRSPPALKSFFEELSESALTSFTMTLQLVKPQLGSYGTFEDTSVGGVPIFPRTLEDATRWAEWLLRRAIDSYLSTAQYRELVDSCKSRFPDFPHLKLPSIEELAQGLRDEITSEGRLPRRYWYVQAPKDLQGVTPEFREAPSKKEG